MDNMIENPKTNILPDEIEFNDYDILEDTLITLKHINEGYGTMLTEASNKQLKTKIENISKPLKDSLRDIFNLMFEKGWYKLEEAKPNKITTIYNDFNSKNNQLN